MVFKLVDGIPALSLHNPTIQDDRLHIRIKSFIILDVLRQSVKRVGGAFFRVIAPASTLPFEEMSQRWRAVGNPI